MRHHLPRLFAIAALAVGLAVSGCFHLAEVVRVRRDGSGTITVTMLATNETVKKANEMWKEPWWREHWPGGLISIMEDPRNLQDWTHAFGNGVELVTVEKLRDQAGEGIKATLSFDDITKVRLTMDMLRKYREHEGPWEPPILDGEVSFAFEKGPAAKLTVKTNHERDGAIRENLRAAFVEAGLGHGWDEAVGEPADGHLQQAALANRGMRLKLIVEVEGEIVATNARHHTGSQICLEDMPFEEFFKDRVKYRKIMHAPADSRTWEQTIKTVETLPGAKAEPKDTITVEFK